MIGTILLVIWLVLIIPAWYFTAREIFHGDPNPPRFSNNIKGGNVWTALMCGGILAVMWPLVVLLAAIVLLAEFVQDHKATRLGERLFGKVDR